jgi:hypothetical protein
MSLPDKVYFIRFYYLPPGAWDTPRWIHCQSIGSPRRMAAWVTTLQPFTRLTSFQK